MGYANNYATTLTAGITAIATTCTVASTTGIPATPFTAVIAAEGANADEIVLVTNNAAGTFTITRAYEPTAGSSSASAHGSGAVLAAVLTAGGMTQISRDSGAASDYLAEIKLTADTQYRLIVGLDGSSNPQLLLGPGSTTAPDTHLWRSAAGVLTLDPSAATATAGMTLVGAAGQGASIQIDGSAGVGSSGGTGLIRLTSSDSGLTGFAGSSISMIRKSDGALRMNLADNSLVFGPGSSGLDVRLLRQGAHALSIDDGALGAATLNVVGTLQVGGARVEPPGMIAAYGGATAPTGWLLCDGTSYATALYPDLFAVLGYVYGGAGSSFNVPDLRQRFPLGLAAAGTGNAMGATGGAIDHTHSSAAHTHGFAATHVHSSAAHTHGFAATHTHTGAAHQHTVAMNVTSGVLKFGVPYGGGSSFTASAQISGAVGSSGTVQGYFTESVAPGASAATAPGTSDSTTPGNTGATAPGTSDSTTPGATGTQNPPYLVVQYIIKT